MPSPFEQAGFNVNMMTPSFQMNPAAGAAAQPTNYAQPPIFNNPPQQPQTGMNFVQQDTPQTALQMKPEQPESDEFVLSSNATEADIDAIKAEIKEELKREMEQEEQEEKAAEEKANKKGPIRRLKDCIGSVKKFNVTASEYTKAGLKGIASGAIVGSIAYGALTLAKKPGPAKVAGIIGAVGAMGVNLWNASLKANEKRSMVDHTWGDDSPILE